MPRAEDFREALAARLRRAGDQGQLHLDVNAGDLHADVGGYPGPDHRMPNCCQVMLSEMAGGDEILKRPPNTKGHGARLTIRYRLPRSGQET